jgi:RNA polymerase sigma factor (sigma-70 family)
MFIFSTTLPMFGFSKTFHSNWLSFAVIAASALAAASDEALMQAYASGDTRAFSVLYTRHKGPFWRYLTRLIGSSAEGEELYQDAWQRVIGARDSFAAEGLPKASTLNGGGNFRAWLYRIGHNLALDRLRHRHIAPESSLDDSVLQFPAASEAEPEARHISQQSHEKLMQSLAALPPEQREVILLRAEGEMTLEEIGALTGLGRETIKSRLRYALAKLKHFQLEADGLAAGVMR